MAHLPALHFPVRACARWIVPFVVTLTLILTFTLALWPRAVFAATIDVDGWQRLDDEDLAQRFGAIIDEVRSR